MKSIDAIARDVKRMSLLLLLILGVNNIFAQQVKTILHGSANLRPAIFGENIISTEDDEFGGSLSPDGKLFFFSKKSPSTGRASMIVICMAEYKNNHWGDVIIAPFSGIYRDFNPQFSPDGGSVYFMSNRPVQGDSSKADTDIWFVKKTATGWSDAQHAGQKINSPYTEYACSFANNGDMYFSSARNGKSLDIYVSKLIDDQYQDPEPLDSMVNSAGQELDPCISPDGKFLLFSSADRGDMLLSEHGTLYPRSDIYISYNLQGKWTKAKRLPPPVNSTADDSNPFISRNGKLLFFTSKRGFVSIPMKNKLSYILFEKQLHSTLNNAGNIYTINTNVLKN